MSLNAGATKQGELGDKATEFRKIFRDEVEPILNSSIDMTCAGVLLRFQCLLAACVNMFA